MVLYNLVVRLYGFAIRVASVKKQKARQWVKGRRDWRNSYQSKVSVFNTSRIIWIHCASYGEFEQGRPLIEAVKQKYPESKIVLTFFSPSGYEIVRNWGGAEVIGYLPLDTPSNARDFIRIVRPSAAIFIKYEFWLNYLTELKKQGIKTYLVSAVFKPHHPFFKWYGAVFRNSLKTFTKMFIQDEASGDLLAAIGMDNYEVSGDTRFDRVLEVKARFQPIPEIEEFKSAQPVIIGGSTWPEDEKVLLTAFKKISGNSIKLILVPHEVDEEAIRKTVALVEDHGLSYSLFTSGKPAHDKQILIVDTIGYLSKLYHYCELAYIGGGFNGGIHNCLEAAVYFKPVLFAGNSHHKYNEAVELLQLDAAVNISDAETTAKAIEHFLTIPDKDNLEARLKKYFKEKSGTTQKVLDELQIS